MKMKKILAIILSVVMLIGSMATVSAEGTTVEVSTNADLITVLNAGNDVKIVDNFTVDNKVTVPDGAVIDLNGKTLNWNVENSYFGTSTVKNGNIVFGKDDVKVCDGYFLINAGKTLTLDGVNITSSADGMKCYSVFHLKTGAAVDVKNSTIDVAKNEYAPGYVVYANEATAKADFTNSTVSTEDVAGVVHAATTITSSSFTVKGTEGTEMEHGINRSAVTIKDSEVSISGGTGRGITAQHGPLVIEGNSTVEIFDMAGASIELRSNQTVTVAETASVSVDKAVTAETGTTVTVNGTVTVNENLGAVAKVGDTYYETLTAAIEAAAPSGTVELINDTTVDEWVMYAQNMTHSDGSLITLDMNGLTINGNNHALTINKLRVSTGNGHYLFTGAKELNISDLTINQPEAAGGISLQSGEIRNVTFNGGIGVMAGTGEILIDECEFNTDSYCIYYEEARENLTVNKSTFNVGSGNSVIFLRGGETFTNNTVLSGEKVRIVSGSPVVTGNNFTDGVIVKVYNAATATIENNTIENIEIDNPSEAVGSVFSNNTLSEEAETILKEAGVIEEKSAVAKVGDTYYSTLAEAMGKFNGRTVEVLCNVEEDIEGFWDVTLITNVPGGVTITNTNTNWVDFDDVTVGAGVTVNIDRPYSGDSENVILGTLVAGNTYYHGYDAKTTIKDGGNVIVKGTTILRYNENTDSGIYIYGDGDDSTVEFDCDYYIGSYSGTLYAENANIEAGYYLLKNSYDNSDYSDMFVTLDNSTITVVGTTDTQDSFIIDDQVSLVLKNGSSIEDVRDFNILAGANLTFSIDAQSTISATYMNIADGVPFEAKKNADGTYGIMNKIEADLRITTAEELLDFAESVNAGNDYSGKTVVLMNDIDMKWTGLPIGTSANPFKGTFDGRNQTISNFTYHHVDETTGIEDNYVGLFGKMVGGTIENVTVHNPTIEGGAYVAGIVGQGYTGIIDNCHVTGEIGIEGNYMVGGISGQGYAKITNCSVIGAADWDYNIIRATYKEADLEGDKVGGIVGHCAENADVINCTVKNVTIEGTRNVAGIAGNGFENSDFIDCTVENVTIGTNATEEYANTNKDSMCIGGIVGIFAKGDYSGGTVTNATVSNVTFTNANNVTVSAGAITGGHRGASKTEAPYLPADNTALNNIATNITGATNTYMETREPVWATAKDAGFYLDGETKFGMMRFLFHVDVDENDILDSGIKYIKSGNIEDKVNAYGVSGNKPAFYGDVVGIEEGTEGTYIAVAYVETANGTFWSDAVECSPNFTKLFTEYNPAQ